MRLIDLSRIFWLNVPFATIPLFLLFILIDVPKSSKSIVQQLKSMDWIGIGLVTGGLSGLLYSILSGGSIYPWTSPRILAPLIIGALAIILFVVHETYVATVYIKVEPLYPMRIFSNQTAVSAYTITLVHGLIVSSIINYYAIYVCSNPRTRFCY